VVCLVGKETNRNVLIYKKQTLPKYNDNQNMLDKPFSIKYLSKKISIEILR